MVVLVHFSGEEVDMASDSPARSLDEIDLSALRVSKNRFIFIFIYFFPPVIWVRVQGLGGRGLGLGFGGLETGKDETEGTWSLGWEPLGWLSAKIPEAGAVHSGGCGREPSGSARS